MNPFADSATAAAPPPAAPTNAAPTGGEKATLPHRPRIIVLGNEKGGSGKSTAAMHLIVGLLRAGKQVGSIDIDSRQATLTRYLENRAVLAEKKGVDLPLPTHRLIPRAMAGDPNAAADEAERFTAALDFLSRSCEVIVIDTPGSDDALSRMARRFFCSHTISL
jgi:chromosome partitioning protein